MTNPFSTSYRRLITTVVCASAACILSVQPALAQPSSFQLSGVITDLDAAPLEGVRVELLDVVTETSSSVATDARGRFELKVPQGRYRARVSFRELEITSEEAVEATSGTAKTLDLELYVNQRARTPFCFSAACVDRLPGIGAPHRPDAR